MQVKSSPALGADGTIYVGLDSVRYVDGNFDREDDLQAVAEANGAVKWKYATGGWVAETGPEGSDMGLSPPVVRAGAEGAAEVYVNPPGTRMQVNSSPALGADGTIYVGSGDFKLYAVAADGTEKWAFATGDQVEGTGGADQD